MSMTFLYCGFISYLVPGYRHDRADGNLYLMSYDFDKTTVLLGVQASLLGLFGFLLGMLLAQSRVPTKPVLARFRDLGRENTNRRRVVLALGGFSAVGFALTGADLQIPLIQATLQVARNTGVTAVCLGAAAAVLFDGKTRYGGWIAIAALIPLAYLILFGFLSYGFIAFTCFAAFWLAVLRKGRLRLTSFIFGSAAVVYSLLSVFLTWMQARDDLRAVLWGGAGFSERLRAIWAALKQLQPLNFANFAHLDLLNMRLNQYIFVGKVIQYHQLRPDLRLNGESLYLALLAWVPRFLWPGKPAMGGSDFLATHSGMQFASSASFGTGPVIEFFVNFGWPGILLGFIVLGALVTWLDRKAARALYSGDLIDFARWFTVGLAFIAPLTSMFFMVNTALMTFAILTVVKIYVTSANASVQTRRYVTLKRTMDGGPPRGACILNESDRPQPISRS
jgi:hypothetical protein